MSVPEDEDTRTYQVVINDEEQYSIWPAEDPVPAGWRATGPSGAKAGCLAWIDENWTDMRPRSLRVAMAGDERDPATAT
jgi:MbtH protein